MQTNFLRSRLSGLMGRDQPLPRARQVTFDSERMQATLASCEYEVQQMKRVLERVRTRKTETTDGSRARLPALWL